MVEYVFEYTTEQERQDIINAHSDLYLSEIRNVIEGNFVVLTDAPKEAVTLQDIKNNTDLILLKQEGII